MPIQKSISSRANAKQTTGADFPNTPAQPVTLTYGPAVSTAAQTVINLGFAVPQSNTANFLLSIDGKLMSLGAGNDFTFTNIQSNGTSSQVTLNSAIIAGLNIQAWYMGILVPNTAATSILTVNSTLALQPTVQKFLSGSGTYTAPAGVKYIRVRMVGGGGGGSGSATIAANNYGGGTAGGNTTFGTTLLVANGGGANPGSNGTNAGGAGGSASLGTGPIGIALAGAQGCGSGQISTASNFVQGSSGGSSFFGGAGAGGIGNGGGGNAATNTGSGGGGAGNPSVGYGGAGGGAGGYVDAIISSPSATYSYAVGSAGSGGAAGTGGFTGGNGAAGLIIVEEFYV